MLDSTEIYSGVEWSIVDSAVLPYGTVWSQTTNFDEKILLFGMLKKCLEYVFILLIVFLGGSDYQQTYYDFILEFSPDTEAWAQIGVMASALAAHGVANVNFEDFQDACAWLNG